MDLEDGDALRLIPTAVRLLTERASHGDWVLRSNWLSHLGKSYKYAPGWFIYSFLLAQWCPKEFLRGIQDVSNKMRNNVIFSLFHYFIN